VSRKKTVRPKILVLEGLWNDTAELVDLAGGEAYETTPWSEDTVKMALKSGRYHGLLLTGGSDVNPLLYGEQPHHTVYGVDHVRDAIEMFALEHARKHGMAVLGICRGSQIMCVSRGGKLVQDVQTFLQPIHTHRSDDHDVFAMPDARTFRRACMGTAGKFTSLHHQCVRRPGRGMKIAARAADGTVEAIESKDGLMLGVQFHPELSATCDENAFGFFRWLVQAAARVAGGRAPSVDFRSTMENYFEEAWYAREQAKQDAQLSPEDNYGLACGYSNNTVQTPRSGWEEGEEEVPRLLPAPPRKPRQAGDPAIPSMREMVQVIEESTGSKPYILGTATEITNEEVRRTAEINAQMQVQRQLEESLYTCPECAIKFDLIEDRDDHCKFVHPAPPFPGAAARYPELEPPAGHSAWDVDYEEEDEYERLMLENGFDPRDWDDYDG
jgi:putative glutamine amidotransferase